MRGFPTDFFSGLVYEFDTMYVYIYDSLGF